MPKKKDPNNLIKKVCAELGITQKELAERVGLTEITISRWSRDGEKIPQWARMLFMLMIQEERKIELVEIAKKIIDTFSRYKI